ncbi:MAG TPA: PEP-utilizing enzyme, partial [Candidatus Limnocylindria bacterium]|nr:PEP-utilizing enzyme [Candidatus Limnocylindria bacterium]
AEEAAAAGREVILVRPETSPEDVRGMAGAAGVLTARGGLASHAAVVGASSVHPGDEAVEIDGRLLPVGEEITIDGGSGAIYAGRLAGHREVAPEAATLLEWAAEHGIRIRGSDARVGKEPIDAAMAEPEPELTQPQATVTLGADDVLRALLVKGAATPEQLGDALLAAPEGLGPAVERLMREGLAERVAGAIRLSTEGRLRSAALFDADRAALGETRCVAYLESFHAFDTRMKEIVTAWQVRGEELNDHTDASYDARVLDELGALHAEMARWLDPLCASLPRFAVYRSRLSRAAELARGADQRYVASPRVDSYHSVWFELHEDLIRLAGRRRSEG